MTKKVFHIEKSCIFATSLREMLSLMQHIDNKPFRRASGSILEGRFPFYKAEIRNTLCTEFKIGHTVCGQFATLCVANLNTRVQNLNIELKQQRL